MSPRETLVERPRSRISAGITFRSRARAQLDRRGPTRLPLNRFLLHYHAPSNVVAPVLHKYIVMFPRRLYTISRGSSADNNNRSFVYISGNCRFRTIIEYTVSRAIRMILFVISDKHRDSVRSMFLSRFTKSFVTLKKRLSER